jgi:hypothetical protein
MNLVPDNLINMCNMFEHVSLQHELFKFPVKLTVKLC